MDVAGGSGASVVKLKSKSAPMLSGGSSVSWSVTEAAITVSVQDSEFAKSTSGSSVKLVGPPLTAAACVPLVAHESVYHEPVTFTGSLKVTATFAFVATPSAPPTGDVVVTDGALSPVQK